MKIMNNINKRLQMSFKMEVKINSKNKKRSETDKRKKPDTLFVENIF